MSAYLAKRLHDAPNVEVRTQVEVSAVDGANWLRTLELTDTTGRRTLVDAHALFVCIGGEPRTEWAAQGGIVRDQAGYLVTGRTLVDTGSAHAEGRWSLERDPDPLETSQPGLFAAGDVRHGSTKRVSAAVGEGAMAVGLVHRFLADPMAS
jgi:thioredoxin reductase (NADPH)